MPERLTAFQIKIVVIGVLADNNIGGWNGSIVEEWARKMEVRGLTTSRTIELAEEAVDYWQNGGSAQEEVKELEPCLAHARFVRSS